MEGRAAFWPYVHVAVVSDGFIYMYRLSGLNSQVESVDVAAYKNLLGSLSGEADFLNLAALTQDQWDWLSLRTAYDDGKNLYRKDAADGLRKPAGSIDQLREFYEAALGITGSSLFIEVPDSQGGASTYQVGFLQTSARSKLIQYASELSRYAPDKSIDFDSYFDDMPLEQIATTTRRALLMRVKRGP